MAFHFIVFLLLQLDESNANRLVLRSITAETAGRFRCEVSAEAPSFETVSGHADMTVVRKCHYFYSLFSALYRSIHLQPFVASVRALPPLVLNTCLYHGLYHGLRMLSPLQDSCI